MLETLLRDELGCRIELDMSPFTRDMNFPSSTAMTDMNCVCSVVVRYLSNNLKSTTASAVCHANMASEESGCIGPTRFRAVACNSFVSQVRGI